MALLSPILIKELNCWFCCAFGNVLSLLNWLHNARKHINLKPTPMRTNKDTRCQLWETGIVNGRRSTVGRPKPFFLECSVQVQNSMTEQPQHWPHVQQSHNHRVQFSGGVANKDACGVRSLTMYCWFKIFELQLELATCLHPGWQWGTVDSCVKGQACPCRCGQFWVWLRNGTLPYVVDDMIVCYRFKNERL